ncbi:MAG: hypothetical protein QM755_15570 [Luteolibacter sp.]
MTVPAALAGVIGPCPKCQTRIQAPALPAIQPPPAAAAPAPAPPAPPVQPTPPPAPAPALVPAPAYHAPQPAPEAPPVLEVPVIHGADGKPAYKPEPRQLPNRREGMEPIGKRMPDSMWAPQEGSERHAGAGVLRLLVPVVFLGLAVALVLGILAFLNHQQQPPAQLKSLLPVAAANAAAMPGSDTAPKPNLPPAPPEPDETAPVAPPTPDALTPPDPSSSPVSKPQSSTSAYQILDRFLSMKTLEERLPLMETSTSQADLQASCLSSSLPPRVSVTPSIQTENTVERSTDYFFQVKFSRPVGGNPETYNMLVRQRGNQEPKVVADPFLDLYGENSRLRRFAAAAVEKPAIFRVYVEAIYLCNNPKIPNYDKKFTIRLRGEDSGDTPDKDRGIAIAYSGKASAIGELLQDSDSGLLWGRAKACTIVLNWNTKDDPAHPYIEANTIKSLSWNP